MKVEELLKNLSREENRRFLKEINIIFNTPVVEDISRVAVFIPRNIIVIYPRGLRSLRALEET